jgi:hypothetical protein
MSIAAQILDDRKKRAAEKQAIEDMKLRIVMSEKQEKQAQHIQHLESKMWEEIKQHADRAVIVFQLPLQIPAPYNLELLRKIVSEFKGVDMYCLIYVDGKHGPGYHSVEKLPANFNCYPTYRDRNQTIPVVSFAIDDSGYFKGKQSIDEQTFYSLILNK